MKRALPEIPFVFRRSVIVAAAVASIALVATGCAKTDQKVAAPASPPTTSASASSVSAPPTDPAGAVTPTVADTPFDTVVVESIPAAAGDALAPIGQLAVATVKAPVWGKCSGPQAGITGLVCAKVTMPIDHTKPDGKTFQLAMSKVAAKGKKRGSMFVNPGGPGGSGVSFANAVANRMPTEVRDAFDVIGFDPRGTGESMPIDCVADKYLDESLEIDPTPESPEEKAAGEKFNLEAACLAKYPDIDAFSTLRVVQDMDALRTALGDTTFTYYGVSYGSYLGATYAAAFPNNVSHMVLDGAFLPETTGNQSTIVQFGGFNKAFDNWAAWCQKEVGCEFNAPDVPKRYLALIDSLDTKPLPVGKRSVDEGVIYLATISSLYSKFSWPIFGAALKSAENGDGSGLLSLADNYSQRDPKTGKYDPLGEANPVISCASGITQPIEGDSAAFAEQIKQLGVLGRFVSDSDWKTACNAPQPKIEYTGTAPIIVIGGKNDPATPYSQALTLTAALGSKASLITFTGEGHGGLFESTCAKDAVRAYYLEDKTPAKGLQCEQAKPAAPTAALAAIKLPPSFEEIPLEEGAVLLGLDAANFASRTFRIKGPGNVATAQLTAALLVAGYKELYTDKIPEIPDSSVGGFQNAPDFIIFGSFGPKGMGTADLQSVQPLTGTDSTLVVLTTPINEAALKSLGG
jgi:pimeloyl-ACP methyl ester carboxylesterase